jgi:hypothetical protein
MIEQMAMNAGDRSSEALELGVAEAGEKFR